MQRGRVSSIDAQCCEIRAAWRRPHSCQEARIWVWHASGPGTGLPHLRSACSPFALRAPQACDAYGYGVLLHEMWNHRLAWSGVSPALIIHNVTSGIEHGQLEMPPDAPPAYTVCPPGARAALLFHALG